MAQEHSNVFVIGSGRCGTSTFAKACEHIENWSVAHESKAQSWGYDRLDYPHGHIECDCRLSWRMGSLVSRFPDAFYVHLVRDQLETAKSWSHRANRTMMRYWWRCVLLHWHDPRMPEEHSIPVAMDMVRTANDNVAHAIRNARHVVVWIETPRSGFEEMWRAIGAKGDLDAALDTLKRKHNCSMASKATRDALIETRKARRQLRIKRKLERRRERGDA